MASPLSPEQSVDLLRTMLRMRRVEEQVMHFGEEHQGLLRGQLGP